MTQNPKIYGLIVQIMRECPVVEPTKVPGSEIKYPYRKVAHIAATISNLCQKHSVVMTVETTLISHVQMLTKSGSSQSETMLSAKYRWTADDGSFVESTTIGEARDMSDKSANKAMSAALKYALIQTFQIASEEIEDSDDEAPAPATKVAAKTQKADPIPERATVVESESESEAPPASGDNREEVALGKLKEILKRKKGQREVLLYMMKQEHEDGDWKFPASAAGEWLQVSPIDLKNNIVWTEWMVQVIESASIQEDGSVF